MQLCTLVRRYYQRVTTSVLPDVQRYWKILEMFGNARCLFPSSAKLESQTPPSVCRFCELVLCLSRLLCVSLQLGSWAPSRGCIISHPHRHKGSMWDRCTEKNRKKALVHLLVFFFSRPSRLLPSSPAQAPCWPSCSGGGHQCAGSSDTLLSNYAALIWAPGVASYLTSSTPPRSPGEI